MEEEIYFGQGSRYQVPAQCTAACSETIRATGVREGKHKRAQAIGGSKYGLNSVLTQLRTGHIPLNEHLHRIKLSETPYCPYCPRTLESINHFLLHCSKYIIHRHTLVSALKRDAFCIPHMLSDPPAIRHTLNYINATGRFSHIYGDITAELMEEIERP